MARATADWSATSGSMASDPTTRRVGRATIETATMAAPPMNAMSAARKVSRPTGSSRARTVIPAPIATHRIVTSHGSNSNVTA